MLSWFIDNIKRVNTISCTNELKLMKLYTVWVSNLSIWMKEDNHGLSYLKGENSSEITQGR